MTLKKLNISFSSIFNFSVSIQNISSVFNTEAFLRVAILMYQMLTVKQFIAWRNKNTYGVNCEVCQYFL